MSSEMLSSQDCLLLAPVFEHEAGLLFPLPAKASLHVCVDEVAPFMPPPAPDVLPCPENGDDAVEAPLVTGNQVIIPLALADGETGCFLLTAADPALLRKLAPEWLLEFRDGLIRQLLLVRKIYLDPATGLYNERALKLFLRTPPGIEARYALYVISTFFIRRSTEGGFRMIRHLAGFFSAIGHGVLFFLGQGVFALLVSGRNREQRLALSHSLQRSLKREGLQKVHVAFADFSDQNEDLYSALMQGLAVAEKRGPFGICDVDVLRRGEPSPFALFATGEMRRLQRWWRGMDRFSLLLFQTDGKSGQAEPLVRHLSSRLKEHERCLPVLPDQAAVLLPRVDPSRAESRARELAGAVEPECGSVSVGIGWYPCLKHAKTTIVGNCRKALMHGSFYGPGSVVIFDSLSLNVSGDWYFEEGDFRRAVKEYSQGLLLNPGESNLLNSLGVALMEMNQTSRAIKVFQQVLDQDSDNYMALVNLGYALQKKGRDREALACFENGFTVQFHSGIKGTDLYQQLARMYCSAGRYDKALPVLELWEKNQGNEDEFLLYRLLGQTYAETGQPEKGMRALQRALRLYPHDSIAMSLLGLLYVSSGQGEEAGMVLLRKALQVDDSRADNWFRLARACHLVGRGEEALNAVRQCLRLQRGHVAATLFLADLQGKAGREKQAARLYRRVLTMKGAALRDIRAAEDALGRLTDRHDATEKW